METGAVETGATQTEATDGIGRRLIGIPVNARTQAAAERALREIAKVADIAELRLDLMDEYDLPRLLRDRPCPVIVTNRPEREGGRFQGSEEARVRPLREAIGLGVEYVDVEHDSVHLVPERGETKLVVSSHDFAKMPRNLVERHGELLALGADVVKVVGTAQRVRDNLPVFDVLAQARVPTIAIAMGEAGLLSRVLALRYPQCFLTYASLGKSDLVAPGQLPVSTLRDVYHVEQIGAGTAVYGVLDTRAVSERLLSSLNAATRAAEIDGVWVPIVTSGVEIDSTASVARGFRRAGVVGCIVTGPTQESVVPVLSETISRGPRGQVNAVRWIGERLVGAWTADLSEAFAFVTGRRVAITL